MRLNGIFWTVVAVDVIFFVVLLVLTLAQPGAGANGGREMGVFFFVIVPVMILAAAIGLYVFTTAMAWKVIALLVVAVPGAILGYHQVDNLLIDRGVQQNALGRGYFRGEDMKAMGAAVVRRDIPALQQLGPRVDINTAGEGGVTLLNLAATRAFDDDAPQLPVIEALLALGARPDSAMDTAVKIRDPAILAALLMAHGNPNQPGSDGQPLAFGWLAVMPAANLRLLIDHGLDVNVKSNGTPLAWDAALHERWDLVALLGERGANLTLPRDDGRTVAGEVERRARAAKAEGKPVPPDLLRVQQLLEAA